MKLNLEEMQCLWLLLFTHGTSRNKDNTTPLFYKINQELLRIDSKNFKYGYNLEYYKYLKNKIPHMFASTCKDII